MKNTIILFLSLVIFANLLGLLFFNNLFSFQLLKAESSSATELKVPSTPEKTILDYCIFSKTGNISGVKDSVTTLPDSYLRMRLDNDPNENKSDTAIIDKENVKKVLTLEDKVNGFRRTFGEAYYQILLETYPNTIKNLDLEFKEVISKNSNGDDAQLLIKFQSKQEQFSEYEFNFFLHRESQKWKIFKIEEGILSEAFPK